MTNQEIIADLRSFAHRIMAGDLDEPVWYNAIGLDLGMWTMKLGREGLDGDYDRGLVVLRSIEDFVEYVDTLRVASGDKNLRPEAEMARREWASLLTAAADSLEASKMIGKQTAGETRVGRGAMQAEKDKADAAFSAMSEDERRELAVLGRFERPQVIEIRYGDPDTLGVGGLGMWPLWVGIVEEMLEIWAASNGIVFKSMVRKRRGSEVSMGLLREVQKMLSKQGGASTVGEAVLRKIVEAANDISEAMQYLRDVQAALARVPDATGMAEEAGRLADELGRMHDPIGDIQVRIQDLVSDIGKSGGRHGRIISVDPAIVGKQDGESGKIVGGGDYGSVVTMVVELDDGETRTLYFERRAFGDMVEGLDLGDPPTLIGREVIVHGDPGQETVEFV